jgi:hypothetical protein
MCKSCRVLQGYVRYALERPDALRVVGVAEPRAFHRNLVRDECVRFGDVAPLEREAFDMRMRA